MRYWGICVLAVMGIQASVWAACTTPAGEAGTIFYNTTHNVVQFCDGTDWWDTGVANSSAASTGCSTPSATEGTLIYNSTHNVMQFCNGEEWVNMGDQIWTSTPQTGCSTPTATAGTLFYNTSVQRVQFCNGNQWVNAVHAVLEPTIVVQQLWTGLGGTHSCALLSDTTVKCWGNNGSGRLGNNSTTASSTPVTVLDETGSAPLTGVQSLTLGHEHTCAMLSNSTSLCWGNNTYGQLGNNTTTPSSLPVAVQDGGGSSLTNIQSLSSGRVHTCAVMSDNTAKCWGYNPYGQLGDNSTTQRNTPVNVLDSAGATPLTNVQTIETGQYHSCAILTGGSVQCWGLGNSGQVGDGLGNLNNTTPKTVSGMTTATALALGWIHSCAVLSNNTAQCWGGNSYGQLGDNTDSGTYSYVPVAVQDGAGSPLAGIQSLGAGQYHSCALMSGNTAKCWGWNTYGQLGDGTTTQRNTPVTVQDNSGSSPLTGVASISLGQRHSCARMSSGGVQCWGWNYYGELGDGSTTQRETPVSVGNLP